MGWMGLVLILITLLVIIWVYAKYYKARWFIQVGKEVYGPFKKYQDGLIILSLNNIEGKRVIFKSKLRGVTTTPTPGKRLDFMGKN